MELAIDRHVRWYERPPPASIAEESGEQLQALNELDEREEQARLRELLGEEKLARLQAYMESRSTRIQIDQLRPQFTGADALREDQVEPLIAALHVERARMEQELREYRQSANWGDPGSGEQHADRQFDLQKAAYERMPAAAAAILSSSQVKRLQVLLKRETESQELLARMNRGQSKDDPPGEDGSN